MDNKIEELENARLTAFKEAFEYYNFQSVVEDFNPVEFTSPGNEFTSTVYLENKETPDDGSIKAYFTVVFDENQSTIKEAYAIDTSGNIFGELPSNFYNKDKKNGFKK